MTAERILSACNQEIFLFKLILLKCIDKYVLNVSYVQRTYDKVKAFCETWALISVFNAV